MLDACDFSDRLRGPRSLAHSLLHATPLLACCDVLVHTCSTVCLEPFQPHLVMGRALEVGVDLKAMCPARGRFPYEALQTKALNSPHRSTQQRPIHLRLIDPTWCHPFSALTGAWHAPEQSGALPLVTKTSHPMPCSHNPNQPLQL